MDVADLLECSVCLEPLGRNHRVLPCQHTFCLPCLEDLERKFAGISGKNDGNQPGTSSAASSSSSSRSGFLCPECRARVDRPAKSLPTNVILNRILEGIEKKTSTPTAGRVSLTDVLSSSETGTSLPQQQQHHHQLQLQQQKYPVLRVGEHRKLDPFLPATVAPEAPAASTATKPRPPSLDETTFGTSVAAAPPILGNLNTNPFLVMLDQAEDADRGVGGDGGRFPETSWPVSLAATVLPFVMKSSCGGSSDSRVVGFNGRVHEAAGSTPASPVPQLPPKPSFSTFGYLSCPPPSSKPKHLPAPPPSVLAAVPALLGPPPTDDSATSSSGLALAAAAAAADLKGVPDQDLQLDGQQQLLQPPRRHSTAVSGSAARDPESSQHWLVSAGSAGQTKPQVSGNSCSNLNNNVGSQILPPLRPAPKPPVFCSTRPPLLPPPHQQKHHHQPSGKGFPAQSVPSGGASSSHQVYRALYDYSPVKPDELSLKKDQLYFVVEKCRDGWFKGSSLATLKTGAFPGNYVVVHVQDKEAGQGPTSGAPEAAVASQLSTPVASAKQPSRLPPPPPRPPPTQARTVHDQQQQPLKQASDALLIDDYIYVDVAKVTSSSRSPGEVAASNCVVAPSSSAATTSKVNSSSSPALEKRQMPKFKAVTAYPASSKYELNLSVGDVLFLIKQSEDGWCKGMKEATGETGLFPASFVQKL